MPKVQQTAASLADELRAASLKLQAESWPSDVQAATDEFAKAWTDEAVELRGLALLTKVSQLVAQFPPMQVVANKASADADLVRQKLGLPAFKES